VPILSIVETQKHVKTCDPFRSLGILRNAVYPISEQDRETIIITVEAPPVGAKYERRLQAVLALCRGEAVATVTTQYRIGRSALDKFRARALVAMRAALSEHPRGPRQPHNRLAPDRELTDLDHTAYQWTTATMAGDIGPWEGNPPSLGSMSMIGLRPRNSLIARRASCGVRRSGKWFLATAISRCLVAWPKSGERGGRGS
jgi:hypothetical protein